MRRLQLQSRSLAVSLALLAGSVAFAPARPARAQQLELPARISDEAFWRMIVDMSEQAGYFRSDNLVSNELTFQHVIPELTRTLGTGGVYLGVGPDQNFTYVAALKPRIAFIVDIRRGNVQQHLLYKALIEMASDRAEFLSLLFSRPRPPGLGPASTPEALFEGYNAVVADTLRFQANLVRVRDHLVRTHHFPLDSGDLVGIEYVYRAFLESGPQLTYSFGTGNRMSYGGWRGMPTYEELMVATDFDGVRRSYLANEENFRALRELESTNRLVPLVGDFAGDKALRSVGAWLKERGATVTTIYTSNVEQYLFQSEDAWRRYYSNVATLPLEPRTVFVRAVFNYGGFRDPNAPRGPRSVTVLSGVRELLTALAFGAVQTYWDVIQLSRSPVPQLPQGTW